MPILFFALHLRRNNTLSIKKYLIMIACALSLASCTDYLEPEGEIVYREVTIPENITGIEIGSGMLLVLSDDAPAGKASIRTHANVQPYIRSEMDNDEVVFTINAQHFKNLDVTITVSPEQFDEFTALGGARITSDKAITLNRGSFKVSGGSQATFYGECTTAEIDCSGGSVFHGYDLAVESAEVENSGGSRIELSVMQSLTGENSGGSVISYKGSPSILNVNNSGGSQTVKAE